MNNNLFTFNFKNHDEIYKATLFGTIPLLYLISLVSYNIILDPFGVIRGDMKNQYTEPNQHYLKTKYILNNKNKYNAFLFGNSRVGKIDVSKFKGNEKWYNMTYSQGLPKEHLTNIKTFVKSGVKIKHVIIGLDEISCFISAKSHYTQSLRKPYINSTTPFFDYLFLKPSLSLFQEIEKAKDNKSSKCYYCTIYKDGSLRPVSKDLFIESYPSIHEKDSIFNKPYWPKGNSNNFSECLTNLKDIHEFCSKNNIKLTLFINPIFHKTYETAISHGFLNFVDEVSSTYDLYDFSGINSLTKSKYNYYENSHYRPIIGDFIAKELQSTNSTYFISKENSTQHIVKKHKEARDNNINSPKPSKSI